MRSIAALLLLVLLAGRAGAEEVNFYGKDTDKWWSVTGGANPETGQATCYAMANKKDGSFVQIHRSLVDGELWAIVHDTSWEISGEETGTLRWNFFGNRQSLVSGGNLKFLVKDKNTILILQIESKTFTNAMWNSRYFTLVMPGDVANLSMSFENKGAPTLAAMAECIKANEKKFKGKGAGGGDGKPAIEKVPDSVKDQI